MSEVEKLAKHIRELLNWISWVCLIWLIYVGVVWAFNLNLDYTDSKRGIRSGMYLKVDYGTGLHYLQSSSGHLIPRLNSLGQHVGESDE